MTAPKRERKVRVFEVNPLELHANARKASAATLLKKIREIGRAARRPGVRLSARQGYNDHLVELRARLREVTC